MVCQHVERSPLSNRNVNILARCTANNSWSNVLYFTSAGCSALEINAIGRQFPSTNRSRTPATAILDASVVIHVSAEYDGYDKIAARPMALFAEKNACYAVSVHSILVLY